MKLDDLVFHVGWETLSKTCLRSHGDGVTTLPVRVPAKGRFKLGVGAEFFGLHPKLHAVDGQTCVTAKPNVSLVIETNH